jgi:ankyrin repeat protein
MFSLEEGGKTALRIAKNSGNEKLVDVLINRGANPDIKPMTKI